MNKDKYVYGIKCWEKFPDVTVSIETITPDVAIAMLERNVKNRNLVKNNDLKGVMERGEWKLNGETIVFDKNGNLTDGQHRLNACVSSGVPFTTVVVRGVEPASQETVDIGRKRTVSDFLKMRGYKEWCSVAVVGKALWKKDKYGIERSFINAKHYSPSVTQALDFIDGNYEARIKPLIRKTKELQKKYKGLGVLVTAPLFDEFRKISVEDAEHFYGMLMGSYTPTKKAIVKLIMKLSENAGSSKQLPNEYLAAYIVKAWNSYIDGVEIERLTYSPGGYNAEHFPEISHGIDREISERDAA